MQERPPKYAKRLVFENSVQLREFLDTFVEIEVSRHMRLTLNPFLQEVPSVGKVVFRSVLLEPLDDNASMKAFVMQLLDATLLDGMLCRWKECLARLEPEAIPA